MISQLQKLLQEEPLAQVMSGAKHPTEFARNEEDAEVSAWLRAQAGPYCSSAIEGSLPHCLSAV